MGGARGRVRHEPLQLRRHIPGFAHAAAVAILLAGCTTSATPTSSALTATATSPTPQALTAVPDAPELDWFGLVERYRGVTPEELPTESLYPNEPVGTQRSFWTLDVGGPRMVRIDATLQHIGEHASWYTADGQNLSDADLATAAAAFDDEIWPHVFDTFAPGSGPPGHITIVNADLPQLAGYFSGADASPSTAYRFSNERSMLFMNGTGGVRNLGYQATLAHELQHFAHSLVDEHEVAWIHEGLSELAASSMGLPSIPTWYYLANPTVSLTDWPEEPRASLPNYAGGSLFASYLADRTGIDNIHLLVAQATDGAEGVQAYLDLVSPGVTFKELFVDWLVANLVNARSGVFGYARPPGIARINDRLGGPGQVDGNVSQMGGWYMEVEPGDGPVELRFEGAPATPILPVAAHGGDGCWWSNRGDGIDSTLTRPVDLSGLSSATLGFWSWYELEPEWDRAYVAVSQDGGSSWTALQGRFTSSNDPVGNSFGPSYTGRSGGWREEEIDLSSFAGGEILVRFNLVNDESVNSTGWCVDDIEIAETGFADDAETDGDWQANGFLRVQEVGVEQRFQLRLVTGTGDVAQVEQIHVDSTNVATFIVAQPAVVVLTAMAPKTTQAASFTFTATRP
jgi:immune inhibitor A